MRAWTSSLVKRPRMTVEMAVQDSHSGMIVMVAEAHTPQTMATMTQNVK